MPTLRFTKDHEWLRIDGDIATVGITDHAQHALGDVVFVDLPAVGKVVRQGDETATVESVKAASEVYAPVSGTIAAVNTALPDTPALVNTDPAGEGWFFALRLSAPAELDGLLDTADYEAYLATLV
jgi:glycine cleavage system H protein